MPTEVIRVSRTLPCSSSRRADAPGRSNHVHRRAPARLRAVVAMVVALGAGGGQMGRAAASDGDFYANLRYRVDASLHGCWDEAEFRRRIARRVGYDPFLDDAAVSVQIRITGPANAISGYVQWRNVDGTGMGERRFVAKDGNCARLLAEMDFSVALQIEMLRPKVAGGEATAPTAPTNGDGGAPEVPAAAAPPPAPPPPPDTTTTEEAPLPPPSSAADVAKPARDRPAEVEAGLEEAAPDEETHWRMWVGLGPSLAWGVSPSTTAAARLFLGLRHGDLSVELGADSIYPVRSQSWDSSGFRQVLVGGSAGLCGHHGSLLGCVLAKAGGLNAQGLGLDEPRSASAFIAQAGVRLGTTFDLGETWFLAAHLDTLALLTPCTVQLNDSPVWKMPWLGAFVGIDLGARFW